MRTLEAWETNREAPFVTMKAGGPLDGVVTITAVRRSGGRCVVEALWVDSRDGRRSESLEAASFAVAREIAQAAARQLSLGRVPRLKR